MSYQYLTNEDYHAGIYIRLSQEDKDKKYESDSESIINQKELLKTYCKNNGFHFTREYIDDGYSGTNFDRPAFKQMVLDIEAGIINLVIVKDLSRLGRDHVFTGYYIETFFPEKKVRFISVVENYDSFKNQASNDSSTFIIACNDYFSKQNSLKIRSVLDSKRKAGKFIGSKPCYGYIRDPNDKGHLIPNPEVCEYVKIIFKWRSNGVGISEIATRLTKMGVPTPAGYKNLKISSKVKEKNVWSVYSVNKILKNRMYTGDMVQNTQTKISYKSRKKVSLDKHMWIIVENTHEPLVDKDVFALINKKTQTRNYHKRKRPARLLEDLLYCHECGNRLGVLYRKKANYWSINCNRYSRDPIRRMCEPHFFPYNTFEKIVLKEIKKCFSILFKNLDIKELNDEIIERRINHSNEYNQKKVVAEKEKNKILYHLETLYKDRLENNISIEQYKLLAQSLETELHKLNNTIDYMNIKIMNHHSKREDKTNYTSIIKKLLDINHLNKDLLLAFVERIEADKDRNIMIIFKFDLLERYTFQYCDNTVRNPYGRYGKREN